MAILAPLIFSISTSSTWRMSSPSRKTLPPTMWPGGEGTRRMMDRLVTDLPQPDSPTIPKVSPRRSWKLTPSTAFATPVWSRSRSAGPGRPGLRPGRSSQPSPVLLCFSSLRAGAALFRPRNPSTFTAYYGQSHKKTQRKRNPRRVNPPWRPSLRTGAIETLGQPLAYQCDERPRNLVEHWWELRSTDIEGQTHGASQRAGAGVCLRASGGGHGATLPP